MNWNLVSDRPIYAQLIEQIKLRIVSGMYAPGAKLPPVRDLAAEASVNPNTCLLYTSDLVTASFKGVESVSATTATTDAIANSNGIPPVMIMKDMLYWDTDLYKYFQGFAEGTMTPETFLENMDNYRATMFDAAAAE